MNNRSVHLYHGTADQFDDWTSNRIVTTQDVWEHTFYVYKPKAWSGILIWVLDAPLEGAERAALNLEAEPVLVKPVSIKQRRSTDRKAPRPAHLSLVK